MTTGADAGTVQFGERLIALLDESSYSTTYKFALVLALIDCCMETPVIDGATSVHPRALAQKVIELYWPHTIPFATTDAVGILKQSGTGQAEIVSVIRKFRERVQSLSSSQTVIDARHSDPDGYERLVAKIEWKLVEMPLPRLQRLGGTAVDFVYEIGWDEKLKVSEYRAPGFPQSVRLKPGVARQLIRLAGIIRPLIQQLWLNKVARYNPGALRNPRLDEFLFGADRLPTIRLRAALIELQEGRCFYSQAPLTGKVHIDHFLPWSRYGNDSIQNLVATTATANGSKSAWLAAPAHLKDWTDRLERDGQELHAVATALRWPSAPEGTLNAARSIYLNLPDGIPLWRFGERPDESSHDALVSVLALP